MHTQECSPAKDLHVRSVRSTGAQTIHARHVVTVEQTRVKHIDFFDGRRAEDLSKYGFAGNDYMPALRLMFLDVSSQPELRGFLAPTGIGILGHSQIGEIVNLEIRQLASQRREAGRFLTPFAPVMKKSIRARILHSNDGSSPKPLGRAVLQDNKI